ncbi:ATP-dependent zinc protease family protein [Halomonas faecis]|uniref:ATP-dependent zinc protease family protein n=1 Tax=Halomonas faecis TaxID=1562110 RepID=UPI0013D53BDE|nr:ATP-dependent zinc protease [Halomonas faecis]
MSLASLMLAGCGLTPSREPAPPPVTHEAFEARMDRLEASLSSSCGVSRQALEDQQLTQQTLVADVRELGSLLRQLRSEVSTQDDESSQALDALSACQAVSEQLNDKVVLGRSEWVGLPDVGTYLKARIDTGANTSSLSAVDITEFERDGEDWVRFKLGLVDSDTVVEAVRDERVEAPVERRVRVIQSTGEESRPVVSLMMSLGPIRERVEFTLNDRTHLDYPVLLGRRFFMDIALIDVAEQFMHPRPQYGAEGQSGEASSDDA